MLSLILPSLVFGLASAQSIAESFSFGQRHSLELDHLPGWNSGGSQKPQIKGDKVILTPPYPGEETSSLWTQQRLNADSFLLDTKFLANGPEHGGGSLQFWYTNEGESSLHATSIYTIDKFHGLVIAIDQHGGPGGGIRGFLNDGTISFKNHPHLDTHAFGHCDYPYRNRGLPSNLQIRYDSSSLTVTIDGKPCFSTDKIVLPKDYFLGVTASSSATPDSFEVSKFITSTNLPPSSQPRSQQQQNSPEFHSNTARTPLSGNSNNQNDQTTPVEHIDDLQAQSLKTSTAQFEDLHNRLQSLGHNTERLFSEHMRTSSALAGRIEELHSKLARFDQLRAVEAQVSALTAAVADLKALTQTGGGDMLGRIGELRDSVHSRHDSLEAALPGRIGEGFHAATAGKGGPSLSTILLGILMLQGSLLGVYLWWKKRIEEGGMKGGKYL